MNLDSFFVGYQNNLVIIADIRYGSDRFVLSFYVTAVACELIRYSELVMHRFSWLSQYPFHKAKVTRLKRPVSGSFESGKRFALKVFILIAHFRVN